MPGPLYMSLHGAVSGFSPDTRVCLTLANSTVMVPRNPAFRQKAPGIRGGVWGEAPRFFYFIFFL
jgi:hypothetical protein